MESSKKHIPESCHVCLIYENEEQRQKIVADYIAEGLRKGELVHYFTDKTTPKTVRSWLLGIGMELSETEKTGSFSISKAEKAYCPDSKFVLPQKMIDGSILRYDEAKKTGYKESHACGEMTCTLKDISGSNQLLEYEVLLNSVTSTFPHTGMCQYDARLFNGAALFNVLKVHPFMIAQGQVVSNPFYIKPEEFIAGNT
ncbi:MAG: hypothetical protein HOO91_08205 [Bacteroidales bacterium]|nr:hypothetical protein [Bacteroidales bacterium]